MKSSLLNRKTAVVALLAAAMLLLSGCNLVVKDPEVDARQVILSINGEEITKAEFTRFYDNAYNRKVEEQSYYQQFGIPSQPINPAQVLQETLDGVARDKLLHQKAEELGLTALTEEETKALEEKAQADYNSVLQQVQDYYFANTELKDEELKAAVEKQAADLGLSQDIYLQSAKEGNLHERLHAYAGKDVTVSEEELQAGFTEKVAQVKAEYEADPAAFGTAVSSGQPIYYRPAGYRYIRQVLIPLAQADQDAIKALEGELSPLKSAMDQAQALVTRYEDAMASEGIGEEDQAFLDEQAAALGDEAARLKELQKKEGLSDEEKQELDALKAKLPVYTALLEAKTAYDAKQAELTARQDTAFAAIQAKTDEVYQQASAEGADFNALVQANNNDPGQPQEGYAVSAATTTFVPAFTEAAMALAKVGDISQPVRTNYGYHILRYAADIPEGEATLDSVRDTLRAELLATKQEAAYQAMEEAWLKEADIRKYPERFKD